MKLPKVRIWRDPRSHLWACIRLDIPEGWLNPLAFGSNPWTAYQRYKEMLS